MGLLKKRGAAGVVAGVFVIGAALVAPTASAYPSPGAYPSWCEHMAFGYRCMVGPINVPADQMLQFMTLVAAPSEAGYITTGRATLVDSGGQSIAEHMVHLHHAVWLNPYRRDMTCPGYDSWIPNYDRF